MNSLFCNMQDSKPLADLLDKYWSVEMFWFPFNSLFKWVETILPSSNSEKQLKIPQYPEIPAEAMQEQEEEFTAEVRITSHHEAITLGQKIFFPIILSYVWKVVNPAHWIGRNFRKFH